MKNRPPMACDEESAYDRLDAKMILALARAGGVAELPPRRSYLWNLLRRTWRQRIAVVAVSFAGGPADWAKLPASPEVVFRLHEAVVEPASRILAAEVYRPPPVGTTILVEGGQLVQRIGVCYGVDDIRLFTILARELAAGDVPFDYQLPEGWIAEAPRGRR